MTAADLLANLPTVPLDGCSLRPIAVAEALRIVETIADAGTASLLFREAHPSGDPERPTEALEAFERHIPPPWGVHRDADGLLIGICSILEWNLRHSAAEISLILLPEHRAAAERLAILRGAVDFAFRMMEVNRVWMRCDADDHLTAALAAGAGLLPEARLREYLRLGSGYRDIVIFAVTREIRPASD